MSINSKVLEERFEKAFEEMVTDKGTRQILINAKVQVKLGNFLLVSPIYLLC